MQPILSTMIGIDRLMLMPMSLNILQYHMTSLVASTTAQYSASKLEYAILFLSLFFYEVGVVPRVTIILDVKHDSPLSSKQSLSKELIGTTSSLC